MPHVRYLCSHLVKISWDDGATIANLEEIDAEGAWLESEVGLSPETVVELRSGSAYFEGKITKAEEHEFGWKICLQFSPLTPWSIERFRPEHLLDLTSLPEVPSIKAATTKPAT
jgi:hypothetical protein